MSDCPAYLGVTINSRSDSEELFRYEFLIACPETFDIKFSVPNFGLEQNKTFDIRLTDARQDYEIYLTQMVFEQQSVGNGAERMQQADPRENFSVTVTIYAVVGGVATVCFVLLAIAYLYSEFSRQPEIYSPYPKSKHIYTEPPPPAFVEEDGEPCSPNANLTQKQTAFIGLYIILRIIYSLIFTFTVFFAILMLFVEGDLQQLSKIKTYQGIKHNSSADLATKINEFGQAELLRQGELVTSMQGACSNYIGELFHSMANQMQDVTSSQHLMEMHGPKSSISFHMHERMQKLVGKYIRHADNYTEGVREKFRTGVEPMLTKYKQYLKQIFQNNWFFFSQKLFNESSFSHDRPESLRSQSPLRGVEVDFSAFMEIDEVEKVQLWPLEFWERSVVVVIHLHCTQ